MNGSLPSAKPTTEMGYDQRYAALPWLAKKNFELFCRDSFHPGLVKRYLKAT
jgi:hypothetical protein